MRVAKFKPQPKSRHTRVGGVNRVLRMKAIIQLLKASWRYPGNKRLHDSTDCMSVVDLLLRSTDQRTFTDLFGMTAGEELFRQFAELKGSREKASTASQATILENEHRAGLADTESDLVPEVKSSVPHSSGSSSDSCSTPTSSTDSSLPTAKWNEKRTLWKFILCLLEMPEAMSDSIIWLNKERGTFKFTKNSGSRKVAELWGLVKGNRKMTYDSMTRNFRVPDARIFHPSNQRLVYCFNWEYGEALEFYKSLANPSSVEYYRNVKNLVTKYYRKLQQNSGGTP
ncbi:unnamed protein product [Echinostoma caproni]|uniref:ETS domain-containing protein n=1 Tax=Echinostoma caproni TaxID=27848 RepID=A0A182ZZJ1_9TREM|nr:unnamed protein product [Echinostoma caproni]